MAYFRIGSIPIKGPSYIFSSTFQRIPKCYNTLRNWYKFKGKKEGGDNNVRKNCDRALTTKRCLSIRYKIKKGKRSYNSNNRTRMCSVSQVS